MPLTLPVLGHALALRRDPLGFLESLRGKADLAELRIGPQRAYLPTTAELTEQVLITQARSFHKGAQFEKLRPLLGDGLASAEGPLHRRQRSLVRPAFNLKRFDGYLASARQTVTAHTRQWADGGLLEVDREMYRLAASIGSRILYHDPIDADTAATIDDAGLTVVRSLGKRVLAPFGVLERLPTPGNRRYHAAITRLHQVVDQIIATRRRDAADHGDLLSTLLASTSEDGEGMTDRQVHDEVTTMLGGATESTAVTLAWALYEISRREAVEERLLDEIWSVARREEITLGLAGRLSYLGRIVDETLRLEGPAWMLTRRTTERVRLGDRVLPEGAAVWYSPYLLHHDPEVFREPDRFDPDRWLTWNRSAHHRCAFIPFGAGLRACVGEQLARAELVVVLATLLRDWHFQLVPGTKVERVAGFVLGPSRLPMTVHRR